MSVECPICGGVMRSCFQARVLHKYTAEYEFCNACGYLRAHEPHWLEEAYSSAIAAADTGLVARNISLAIKVASLLYWVMGERGQGRYLDAAGGYGMFTRLMRDLGFDFYWADKYCDNLLARGFEYSEQQVECRAVTAMEVMEHLTDPVAFTEEVLRSANADTLIFTTELYSGEPPRQDWWYYAFPTGQHIGFFTQASIEKIGERLGLHFYSANGLHVLTRQYISEQRLRWATHPWMSKVSLLWIRRHLGSKTMDDHLKMMGSL
jgi:hypothetical protein